MDIKHLPRTVGESQVVLHKVLETIAETFERLATMM